MIFCSNYHHFFHDLSLGDSRYARRWWIFNSPTGLQQQTRNSKREKKKLVDNRGCIYNVKSRCGSFNKTKKQPAFHPLSETRNSRQLTYLYRSCPGTLTRPGLVAPPGLCILERLPSSRTNKQRCSRLAQWPQQSRPRKESAVPVHADHVAADQIGFR